MEQKESLLSKLAKLKKAGLIAVAAASVGLMTSCGPTNETKPQTTDPQTTDVEHGKTEEEQHQEQHEEHEEHKEEEKEYTALLNYVLNNEDIKSSINALKDQRLNYESAAFKPHPYTFIKSVGGDVALIKSNLLPAYTQAYTVAEEPNNLYMLTYFADDTNTYYNEYHLCYTLTEKEMAEYIDLHKNTNFEAVFMNDAVSATRQPTVLSACKSSITAHKEMNQSLHGIGITKSFIGNYGTEILFKDFNQETQKFSVYIFPDVGCSNRHSMVEQRKLGIYYLQCDLQEMKVNNDAFCGPTLYQNYIVDQSIFDITKLSDYTVDATWYTSQYTDLHMDDLLVL
ncbi:MAG: hypothetical protein MJ152_01230 [Clostridia bacterium]|nr:hypothetical protein [Clostridia bacterium]